MFYNKTGRSKGHQVKFLKLDNKIPGSYIKNINTLYNTITLKNNKIREAFKKKKDKFGNCSQNRLDQPTLANLGILNCYFFYCRFSIYES